MVSHICLLVELIPICNSMADSVCLKSYEKHSLLKSSNGGLWKTITGLGPNCKFGNFHENFIPRKALKDLFATLKNRLGHDLPISVNECCRHFPRILFSQIAQKKNSRKFLNLQCQ